MTRGGTAVEGSVEGPAGRPICSFDELLDAVAPLPPLRVAVVGAADVSVLEGMVEAAEAGIVAPVLVGDGDEVAACAADVPGAEDFEVVHAADEPAWCDTGTGLVADGRADALVKGHVHTNAFMRPVLRRLRTTTRVSHVFLVELASYPKLLAITDAAVNIAPDLMAKAAITENAIDLVRRFGVERPKVAALSAVEVVNPAIPSTLDAACLAKMADRGQIHDAVVDGPLAFDVAVSAESARIKGVASPVAGDVDVLVVPDIDAGNILVKDLEYLAGGSLAGIVVGATAPIVLTSRADPPRSRLLSCAVAAYAAST